ncbi:MAG TPA: 2OG-Fe(II) oxygenase [Bradyrhizobium sp.]|nr:2OG-Fe(II) oxygenase [Bradyrhizobium sp.]
MSGDARIRTVTLVLQGGHLIKLGGAVDLPSLIGHLQEPVREGGTIDIHSSTADRLILRREALLGVIDSYTPYEAKPNAETKRSEPFLVKPYVSWENFLPAADHRRVIARALELEEKFEVSKVTTDRNDYRNSVMLSEDEIIGPMFRQRIRTAALDVAHSLGVHLDGAVSDDKIECQITAHRDGGFFHAHSDNGSSSTAGRVLSYVYYFRTRPSSFFGGELKLYEPQIENGANVIGRNYCMIPPDDNSIVFFPSHVWHEVLPTYVPSGAFCDSRFTVNGWIKQMRSE